ncbi:MAG: ornithine cyclodeaminase, partial [Gemmatimonadota bacterium]|nr:ornithine cyclodeaminase [Gemmatimonadota bacterium]
APPPPPAAVEAMRRAFAQITSGEAVVPVRGSVESDEGTTLLMPAWLGGSRELGAKVVSVFAENPGRDLPVVTGAVLLLDADTGRPRALLDGTALTGIRTAAGSALAVELLADPEADVLAVFGAGAQGEAHVRSLAGLRRLREVRLVSRSGRSAEVLASLLAEERVGVRDGEERPAIRAVRTASEALSGAGLVVTATDSLSPVFDDGDLAQGAHVSAVGSYRPDMQEVPVETVARARVVVDQREAAWEEAGDLIQAREAGRFGRGDVAAELGEIVLGRAARGRDGRPITLFKSVGNAAQDVAIAETALQEAEERGIGRIVPF